MSDPQDRAEALDEDVVDTVDDRTGDEYGEALPAYPPDELLGADEDEAPDSFAERTWREEPERGAGRPGSDVGELVDPAGPIDDEPRLVADETEGIPTGPEESAIHLDPER